MCDSKRINLMIDGNERRSMLLIGKSRMGKTYFASNLGAEFVRQGYTVHLIDLGDKWSSEDKERLIAAGASMRKVDADGVTLKFKSAREACVCGKIVANALGFRSTYAVMVIRKAIKELLDSHHGRFSFDDLMRYLESAEEENKGEGEWQLKIWERLESCDEIPDIAFCLDENNDFSVDSVIWDLAGLDDVYAQVVAYLVTYCLLCQQKQKFRAGKEAGRIFVIVDEFQTLDCDKRSIIGTCLTEGQKYGIALILITQFLSGNFNDTIIQQLKQGGFRFYFRLTEEEAAAISREIAVSRKEREKLYKKLITLQRGECLMMGPHFISDAREVTEKYRIVGISCE